MADLNAMLRDARRNHAEGDDGAATSALFAYYQERVRGAVEPAVAGDVVALDLLRAISESTRCGERHDAFAVLRYDETPLPVRDAAGQEAH